LVYACLIAALLARLAMAFMPALGLLLMDIAAIAWLGGFAAFLIIYGPMLAGRTRRTGD
jgi:uncharacterized protein involved in response to NO